MDDKKPNALDAIWACLSCYWKGRLGDCFLIGRCPKCNDTTHPTGKEPVTVPEYVGEIGTRN